MSASGQFIEQIKDQKMKDGVDQSSIRMRHTFYFYELSLRQFECIRIWHIHFSNRTKLALKVGS